MGFCWPGCQVAPKDIWEKDEEGEKGEGVDYRPAYRGLCRLGVFIKPYYNLCVIYVCLFVQSYEFFFICLYMFLILLSSVAMLQTQLESIHEHCLWA